MPHAPQLWMSLCVSTHSPLQQVSLVPHGVGHVAPLELEELDVLELLVVVVVVIEGPVDGQHARHAFE